MHPPINNVNVVGMDPDTRTTLSASIEAALTLAVRAPSVHNSQPWRWRINSDGVTLYADPDRHLPEIDPDRRDLMLSCGAALHHFTVALAALGWEAHVTRLPAADEPNLLASVTVVGQHEIAQHDIALAAAIPRRRTDRRWFSSWPVPRADITLMTDRAAAFGVTLQLVADDDELAVIVKQAVRAHLSDRDYVAELSAWSGRHGTASGVPAENAATPGGNAPFSARVFADPRLHQSAGAEARDDAGVTLVLATERDDKDSQLRAGEATSAVLLTATALGLSACPLTEPLELADTRAAVQSALVEGGSFPQMLLRIGWAALNADPLTATRRRPMADVSFYARE